MLIANHSAGIGLSELICFACLYVLKVGPHRPLAGFAHAITLRIWPLSRLLPAFGCVPSTYEAAHATLAAGIPLLIFPGGDHETLRPIWQANRVDLGGRVGFLRIARAAGVDLVPMRIHGSHYTAPMLLRSALLAHLLIVPRYLIGIKRWGISLLGVLGAAALLAAPLSWPLSILLAYLWLGSPLTLLPIIPATIRFTIGPPIRHQDLFTPDTQDDAQLHAARDHIQATLTALP